MMLRRLAQRRVLAGSTDPITLAMAAVAALACLLYLTHTGPHQFGMDVSGHVKYIRYLSNHWTLPRPQAGWQFYHPPLYYILTGGLMRALEWLGATGIVQDLRWFSLLCYAAFLFYGNRILRMALPSRSTAYYMAWALLLFWPIGIVISSRIDGNVLLYPLFAGAFFHLLRFSRYLAPRDLALALTFAAFGVLTRSSALMLLPITGIALAPLLWRGRVKMHTLFTPGIVNAALLLLFAVGFNALRAWAASATGNVEFIANFNKLGGDLRVKNELGNYLLFPVDSFLSPPFNNVRSDFTGRQYFWIGFLKSALYGEFRIGARGTAQLLNLLLVAMILYVALAWGCMRRYTHKTAYFLALSIGVMVAASMTMRYHYPAASTQDFRYVYPLLIPFAALMGTAQLRYRAAGMNNAACAGPMMVYAFCAFSLKLVLEAVM